MTLFLLSSVNVCVNNAVSSQIYKEKKSHWKTLKTLKYANSLNFNKEDVGRLQFLTESRQFKTRSRCQLKRLRSMHTNRKREIKITRPVDQRVMGLYERKLLIVCNHVTRFGGHRYCGSGDKMLLIYHVTASDHVFKELCDIMG